MLYPVAGIHETIAGVTAVMCALKDIKLFTTQSHPCSYLPGQKAKTLFIDPEYTVQRGLHSHLSELGFRRSGHHIYRPHCDGCQRCIPCRVLTDRFEPHRRFRRIWKKNADLRVDQVANIDADEYYSLYARYIDTRHRDGDMYPATREQYDSFLTSGCDATVYYSIRDHSDTLLGVIVSDHLDNALSAVYTFYEPQQAKRSLGGFAILWQIAEARRLHLPYLYLGYWIRNCDKMNYKTQYKPLELLIHNRWVTLN